MQYERLAGQYVSCTSHFHRLIPASPCIYRSRVEALQKKFNEESKGQKSELVLFKDALEHLMRLSRTLALARGSALLVGVGGSGKQSLARLAAYIAGDYPCYALECLTLRQ